MRYYKYLNIDNIKKHETNNKYNELTESKIWMSSYRDLNDPLENFYNVIFDGCFINWICLVRQYLFSLLLYIDTKNQEVFELNSYTFAMKNKVLEKKYGNIINKVLKDKETIIFCNNLSAKKKFYS